MLYQIFPLFKYTEFDRASEYLVRNLKESGIEMIELDNSIKEQLPDFQVDRLIDAILTQMVNQMYGKNIPQMANFLLVQKTVISKFEQRLINYMKLVNLEGELIVWTPSSITAGVLFHKANQIEFDPLTRWNPNELWDFNDEIDSDKELLNPLNGFLHMYLILKNVNNPKFLFDLCNAGILTEKEIKDADYSFNELKIQLLPYNNFNRVLNVAHAIFRRY